MNHMQEIAMLLERWFAENGRHFPWRAVKDPYRVMVVEFLLQRTKAETVERIHDEFFRRFPDISALAKTDHKNVEVIFSKLGLMYRASRLVNVARHILEKYNGHFPCNAEVLLELNGVGVYIMSAILNFGCDIPTAVVDKNVMRVANRLWGVQHETDARKLIEGLYEYGDHRTIAYALIDLGATVCKDKPRCELCPLNNVCPKLPLKKENWRMLRKVWTTTGMVLKEQPVGKILKWKTCLQS